MRYASPVGTQEERDNGAIWPGDWIDANPYLNWYNGQWYHTGADLNLNKPVFDSDAHAPVYSIADGVVYAVRQFEGWGNVVCVRHADCLSRYGHVENVKVIEGQKVRLGQQIANIGDAGGNWPFHLHLDIARLNARMASYPGDWPGADKERVLRDYYDPAKFLRDKIREFKESSSMASSNLIANWKFEGGHAPWGGYDNVIIPKGHGFGYAPASIPNPEDPGGHKWVKPEAMVLDRRRSLPPVEWGTFTWGNFTWKCFGPSAIWFGLTQTVDIPQPGRYLYMAHLNPDVGYYDENNIKTPAPDPLSGQIAFAHGNKLTPFRTMQPYLQLNTYQWEFEVDAAGPLYTGVSVKLPHPLKANGIFLAALQLYQIEEKTGYFPPRDYVRRYWCFFQSEGYARNWVDAVHETPQFMYDTTGFSPDDACGGGIKSQDVFINPDRWGAGEDGKGLRGFIDKYYPGADARQIKVGTLAEFKAYIADKQFEDFPVLESYGGSSPPNPPPTPPPAPAPATTGYIGIHQLVNQPDGMKEFMAIGPPLFKSVDRIDQLIAAYRMMPDALKPHLKLFFRKYRADEGGLRYSGDFPTAAKGWINPQATDLKNELGAVGIPTGQVIILGPNEVWEHNLEQNQLTIDLDKEMVRTLVAFNKVNGTQFSYATSSMAVGNPQMPDEPGGEQQWQRILLLAQMLRDYTGNGLGMYNCFNYHAYGLCIASDPLALTQYAPYLQNRWMPGYEWLKAKGAPIPFFHGEGGHVGGNVAASALLLPVSSKYYRENYVVRAGDEIITLHKRKPLRVAEENAIVAGMWLNPGQGWNGLISPERAVQELVDHFDEPLRAFNAKHDYKASCGVTTFQWGNRADWEPFNHEKLAIPLASALKSKYS